MYIYMYIHTYTFPGSTPSATACSTHSRIPAPAESGITCAVGVGVEAA